MSTKEQELVLTSGHKESLLGDQGNFKWTCEDLKEIVHMDNRYEKEDGSGAKLSSDLIVRKFEGI